MQGLPPTPPPVRLYLPADTLANAKEGSVYSYLEQPQRPVGLLLGPRKLRYLLHRGTDLQFLKCSFESLKKKKNCFLSPSTTTKCFIRPTCTAQRGGTSSCKGEEFYLGFLFPVSSRTLNAPEEMSEAHFWCL